MHIFQMISCLIAFPFLLAASNEDIDFHFSEKELAFTFLPLNHEEATLIQNQEKDILINTGDRHSKVQLFKQLEKYDVEKIDKLVITNSTPSYTGNLTEIINHYHVHTLISSKTILKQLKKNYDLNDIQMKPWEVGKPKEVLPGLSAHLLAEIHSKINTAEMDTDHQKDALVVRFQYGATRILYMDWHAAVAGGKLMESPYLRSEILKIGDIRKNDKITKDFLKKVNPQVAILTENIPPNQQLVQYLNDLWVDIYDVQNEESLSILLDSHMYQVISFPIHHGPLSHTPK